MERELSTTPKTASAGIISEDDDMEGKKDILILILGSLNIFQCVILVVCELCRICGGGKEKAVKELERDRGDSVPMDKRTTCDASEFVIPDIPPMPQYAGNAVEQCFA